MQQFTVPQFIDVEDKIIGPITTRQFLIMLVAAILIAIFYRLFDFSLFLLLAIMTFVSAIIFAFVKVNGHPFHLFMLNFLQTIKRPSIRVWQLVDSIMSVMEDEEVVHVEKIPSKNINLKTSRLDQMSLIVDTYGQYRGDDLVDKKKTNGGK